MSTQILIPIERNGIKMKVELDECSKDEVVDAINNLDRKQLESLTCLLVGYSTASAQIINNLRYDLKKEVSVVNLVQRQRDDAWDLLKHHNIEIKL